MRFACRSSVIAALSVIAFIASPAGAAPPTGPPPDPPAEAPFPRSRFGVGLAFGFAYAGVNARGPSALLSFRIGRRFNHLVSVYYQGSPFVFWDPRNIGPSGGLQSSALVAFTFSDRVELALGPALDAGILNVNRPSDDYLRFPAFVGAGAHARGAVAVYRTRDTDRAPMGLFLGLDLHGVVPVLPPEPVPILTASLGVSWEWY
jgi:hypothetical protein